MPSYHIGSIAMFNDCFALPIKVLYDKDMESARQRGEAVLAALVAGAAVVLFVGAGVLYFGSTVNPVHTNPAAIPSAAADVDAGRYDLIEYLADGTRIDRGARPAGGARFLPIGPPHALENVGTNPLHIVRVELKRAR